MFLAGRIALARMKNHHDNTKILYCDLICYDSAFAWNRHGVPMY